MSGDVFVDTSGWGNLFDPRQEFHMLMVLQYEQAIKQSHKLVTTNLVIGELVTLFTGPLHVPRMMVVEFIEGMRASPNVDVVHVNEAIEVQAWDLFRTRLDQGWSLVDCSSIVVMREHGLVHALTSDPHFEQAGLVRLLKP